jgi:hypothetical protein
LVQELEPKTVKALRTEGKILDGRIAYAPPHSPMTNANMPRWAKKVVSMRIVISA